MGRVRMLAVTAMTTMTAARGATPPALVHYQGVLRNTADAPLPGTYGMAFRLYSLQAGGDHILTDTQSVAVSAGLFGVDLGGGSIVDGTGPGSYTNVAAAFRDYGSIWLEIQVGGRRWRKALEPLEAGTGLIRVLAMLR